jgi:hypothetical protein
MPGTNDENYESVLLKQQMALFRVLDPNIKVTLSSDGHTLTASNISELAINEVRLITNSPSNNARLHFDNILVYLDNDLYPSQVHGFYPICLQLIEREDVLAFIDEKRTYQPFINGFKDGISINELCDKLSALTVGSPDTFGKVKHYTMVFGNCNNSTYCYPNNVQGTIYCQPNTAGIENGWTEKMCSQPPS